MNGWTATLACCAVATALGAGDARAADIARATLQEGTVRLTDQMLPECNRLNAHGTAWLQRGKSTAQPACWQFDWKRRVFTVVPLKRRNAPEGLVASVLRTLEGGREAGMQEWVLRYTPDAERQRTIPAARFTWLQGSTAGKGRTRP